MRTSCWTRKRGRTITFKPKGGFARLLRTWFAPQAKWFVLGGLAALVTALAGVSYGVLIKAVGDRLQALAEGAALGDWIWPLAGLIVLAASVRAISLYAMTMSNNTGVQRALVEVQASQFDALLHGDYARIATDISGSLVARFVNDVNALRDAGLRLANNAIKGVATVLGVLGAMIWLDGFLALVLLVAYPIAFGPVIWLGERVRQRAKRAQKQVGDLSASLTEGFQAARTVRAYGLEDNQSEQARTGFTERARLFLKVLSDRAGVDPILEVAGGAALAGVLALSVWRVASGEMTIGDLLGFIALVGVVVPEARALGTLSAVVQEGGAAADRVFEIVDAEPQISDPETPLVLDKVEGNLTFEGVGFTYPDGTAALSEINFTASKGQLTALMGPSGAGKSTVFNLILRLYDPSAGEIRLDDQPIRTLSLRQLRGAIALVEQHTVLFNDTILANIACGRPGASPDEVEAAARAANAHEFIMAQPQAYATPVGENGTNLSGGQRQRIGLARALLKDAPILLLDEPTSALDAESEAAVEAVIRDAAKRKTVLVITHREWAADQVLVFAGGRLAE